MLSQDAAISATGQESISSVQHSVGAGVRFLRTRAVLVAGMIAALALMLFPGRRLRAAMPGGRAALSKTAAVADYGKLPLSFEANRGQTDPKVKFLSRGPGYGLFLTSTEAVLSLEVQSSRPCKKDLARPVAWTQKPQLRRFAVLRMRLERANSNVKVSGIDELAGKSNYFIGKDPAKWRRNIPTFGRVKYQRVYPGIDLVYYGQQRQLEYDFVLQPGADPRQVELNFKGANQLRLDADGNLIVSIAGGEVIEHKPVIYQDIDGMRRQVAGGYERRNSHTVGFNLARYDDHRSLTIDPGLVYSTYLGGSGDDGGSAIALDSSGNAYVSGETASSNFPTTARAFQPTFGGGIDDVFVSKLNSSGTALVYSTYLGGSGDDGGSAIALDSSGNAYVTGFTGSSNFPTTAGAFQIALRGSENAFVSKLNSSGSALMYSTYLGGSRDDSGAGIVLDSSGDAYVTGETNSSDFPTTPGVFQTALGGNFDAFVSKLNSSGSALVYSTHLGGSSGGFAIALDSSGDAYVTGVTESSEFPTTAGAFQTTFGGGTQDAFVSKLNSGGSALVYSTYLGGSSDDAGLGIVLDSSGDAYVTGFTGSSNFPTTAGAFQPTFGGGDRDAFVSKLNSSGKALVYSTYLGGSGDDGGFAIGLDSSGNAYVTGFTGSSNFPTTAGALQTTLGGLDDAFVSKLAIKKAGCSQNQQGNNNCQ